MLTKPFSANFNVFAHGIWFLCLHHLLFNIRTHSSHLYACVVSSNFLGKKSIYLYFCHVSKYLHCCRLSRQWILFKENPYSFLACGAADSFCFFFRKHLNLACVEFRAWLFAARPGVRNVYSCCLLSFPDTSPALAVAVLLPDSSCAAAAAHSCFAGINLAHLPVKREHLIPPAFAREARLIRPANPILLQSLSVILPLAPSLLWQSGIEGKYLNKLASHLTNLSVALSLQRCQHEHCL